MGKTGNRVRIFARPRSTASTEVITASISHFCRLHPRTFIKSNIVQFLTKFINCTDKMLLTFSILWSNLNTIFLKGVLLMSKFVSRYTYTATQTMHTYTVYGFAFVCKYVDHREE